MMVKGTHCSPGQKDNGSVSVSLTYYHRKCLPLPPGGERDAVHKQLVCGFCAQAVGLWCSHKA